jgi:hypothetical protein
MDASDSDCRRMDLLRAHPTQVVVFSWEVDGDCVGGMTQEDETAAGE